MPPLDPANARRRTSPFGPLETRDAGPEADSAPLTPPTAAREPARATLFVRLTSRATGFRWLTRLTDDAAAGALPRARASHVASEERRPDEHVRVQIALSTEVACAFGVANAPDLPFTVGGANAAVVLTAQDPGALKSLVVRQILFASTHGASVTEVHSTEDTGFDALSECEGNASGQRSRDRLSKSDSPAASGVRAALLLSAAQATTPPATTRVMDPLPWVIVHDTWLAPREGRWVRVARSA